MISFSGKTVIITGSRGTIASATVDLLSRLSARIVLADLDLEDTAAPTGMASYAMDVCDSGSVDAVFSSVTDRFGPPDVLINCAGIFPRSPIGDMTDEDFRRTLDVNLVGSYNVCRAAARHMGDGGTIVLISSIAGHRGSPNHSHYAASKGGVLSLMRSLAIELAPRLRVNCVSPGPVESPMVAELMHHRGPSILSGTPSGRLARPDEVAKAIAFMASDWSSFINGESLQVNGGLHIHG